MKGFRSYVVAALIAVFGALQMTDWNSFFNDPKAGIIALGSALLMAVMRSLTTTPPATK